MVEQSRIELVERLLADDKLSQCKIAKLAGVSRGTVAGIANGSRPDYSSQQVVESELEEPTGPLIHCPGCGGRVYAPCHLCRVRRIKGRGGTKASGGPSAAWDRSRARVAGCAASAALSSNGRRLLLLRSAKSIVSTLERVRIQPSTPPSRKSRASTHDSTSIK